MARSDKKGKWYKRSGRSVFQIFRPRGKITETVSKTPEGKYFAYDTKSDRFSIRYPSIGDSKEEVGKMITDAYMRDMRRRIHTNIKKTFQYGVEVTRLEGADRLVNTYQAWHMFARNQTVLYPKGGFKRTKEGRSRLHKIREIFMGHDADVFQTLSRGGTVAGVRKWTKISMWTAYLSRVHVSSAAPAGPGFRSIKAYARAQMPLRDTNRLWRAVAGIGSKKDWEAKWKRVSGRNGGLEIANKVPYAKKVMKGGIGKYFTGPKQLARFDERVVRPLNKKGRKRHELKRFEQILLDKEKEQKANEVIPYHVKKAKARKDYLAKRIRKLKGTQTTGVTPMNKLRPFYQLRTSLVLHYPVRTKRIPARNWQTKHLTAEAQAKISRLVEGSIKEFDATYKKGLGHIYGDAPISYAAAGDFSGNRMGGLDG